MVTGDGRRGATRGVLLTNASFDMEGDCALLIHGHPVNCMTGERGSAGVGPLNGYRLLGYYLTWTAGAHPVKECQLLSRVGVLKSRILSASKGSLLGGCDIAEPVLFERQWLVENCRHG